MPRARACLSIEELEALVHAGAKIKKSAVCLLLIFSFKIHKRQRRNIYPDLSCLAVRRFFDGSEFFLSESALSAVKLFFGIKYEFVFLTVDAYAVISVFKTGEVYYRHYLLTACAFTDEAQHIVVRVVGNYPLETVPAVFDGVHRVVFAIESVKVGKEAF